MQNWQKDLRGCLMTVDETGGLVLGRENIVKRAGYRSTQDQIYELMRSGQRLQTAREEAYNKPTGILPRLYGEIDRTVASEKLESTKQQILSRKAERVEAAEKKAAEEKVATPPEKEV
ncbi:MAG: hypothetical protein [Microvirus sp.]|nr:MAG: hypothetical protein [Microvirus sp.]